MKNILIIGSTGFIGQHLKKKLGKNFNLIYPKRKDNFRIEKKIKLKKILNDNIDIVINLSGQISKNEKDMFRTIVIGNKNIIDISKKLKKDLIIFFMSSSLVYGFSKKILNENSKLKPISTYEKFKRLAEINYIKSNINYKILRVSNVYDGKKKGIVKNIITNFCLKKKLLVTNINTFRNYIHIDDFVNIFFKLIKKIPKKKIYNIGHENKSIKNLLKSLEKDLKIKSNYHDKKINLKYLSSQKIAKSKLLNEINYVPKINIENFLKKNILNELKLLKK